jgi:hypothetical protein
MLKERRQAAEAVAGALFAAEKAIDAALASTATLAALMPSSRQAANLSAIVGQDAIMSAISTMQALGVARENIVETHKHLSTAQHDIGLSAVSFGDGAEKPEKPTGHGRLRTVAA